MYDAFDPELVAGRVRARQLCDRHERLDAGDFAGREAIVRELFGRVGKNPFLESPFRCDYGTNIEAGDGFYMNFGGVILDVCRVTIGDSVLCGPRVQILTAQHPLDPDERAKGPENGRPVTIGHRVWLGGGAIVCPGVTIGEGTTVGAGSVVTKDLPPRVLAVGVPARIVREL